MADSNKGKGTFMIVRIWSKPDTQTFIKRLRAKGYDVAKVNNGYVCHFSPAEGKLDLVFKAMIGSRGYLCRINPEYVTEIEDGVSLSRDVIAAANKGGQLVQS